MYAYIYIYIYIYRERERDSYTCKELADFVDFAEAGGYADLYIH